MKSYQTESELYAQIKQTLDNHREDYIPGSWENFVQTRKSRRKAMILRIVSGIAACLLLGFIGFYFTGNERKNTEVIAYKQVRKSSSRSAEMKTPTATPPISASPSSGLVASAAVASAAVASAAVASKSDHSLGIKPYVSPADPILSTVEKKERINTTKVESATSPSLVSTAEKDSLKNSTPLLASNEVQPAGNRKDTLSKSIDTTRYKSPEKFLTIISTKEPHDPVVAAKRKIRLGINFSPGVTTAQATTSASYTGGISADIPLSSNLQITTGLQVENQNIVKKIPGIVSASAAPQNESKTKRINLDVPVNLIWTFKTLRTNSYYVSAGLSSMVYLSQAVKSTSYTQFLESVSSTVNGAEVKSYAVVDQISVTENTASPAQKFELAGRINFMVGMEKKLSGKLYLHIEPYAKIPASGQSAVNSNYTITGINFKISF